MSAASSALPPPVWEEGDSVDSDASIWQLWTEVVQSYPERVAVRDAAGETVTYHELDRLAREQAAGLLAAGVGPGDVVVIAHPRGRDELAAVLGVLAARATYLALDEAAPDDRLAAMLELAAPVAVLGPFDRARRVARASAGRCRPLRPGSAGSEVPRTPADDAATNPEAIAYIAFTSGTSGVPKAVRIPHRGVVRLVRGAGYLPSGPGQRFLRLAPLAFDASTLEIFLPLLTGATVEAMPAGPVAPPGLSGFLLDREITVAWLTAGLFRIMIDEAVDGFAALTAVVTGGDVVSADHARRLLHRFPRITVVNGYGPTENTTFSTVHTVVASGGEASVPIGRPVPGTTVRVVDEHDVPLPIGRTGELVLLGQGLARGYLGAPEQTAAAFRPLPGDDRPAYRTGDLVRWCDGELQYVGRRDRQVKIRGHRVELEEIEQHVRATGLIRDVAVVAARPGNLRILCAVIADPADAPIAELRQLLAQVLPPSMLPQLWTVLDRIPLTANGKVDADALVAAADTHAPSTADDARGSAEAATAESGLATGPVVDAVAGARGRAKVEALIVQAWTDVLGFSDFGRRDGFFDVGGDSLMAAQLHTRLTELLPEHGVRIVDIFRYPSVAALTDHLLTAGVR
ncbi:hypothetical protein GCM10029976_055030 [Kribbella albertanoniae]